MLIWIGLAAALILIVLGVALYVGGVFGSTSETGGQGTSIPQTQAPTTSAPSSTTPSVPIPAVPAVPPSASSTPSSPSSPGPAAVIRQHLDAIGSGNYRKAFSLMTTSYRQQNPSWPTDRTAANPGINIISVGQPQYSSGAANVPVDFYARDRNPTPNSDTQCREFTGTANLTSSGGLWRYNPVGNSLTATVVPASDSNCPT